MKTKKTNKFKKISLLVVLAALICMSLAVTAFANNTPPTKGVAGGDCYTIGDVNGDGAVNDADAVYLLYHSLFDGGYTIKGEGDFDEDTVITAKDALKLWFSIQGEAGDDNVIMEVHAYAEPIWTWSADYSSVKAAYKCACGEDEKVISVTPDVTRVDATCTKAGSITYAAEATYNGVTYETSKTVVVATTGHDIPTNLKACQDKTCKNGCGYVEAGEAHTIDLNTPVRTAVAVDADKCLFKNVYKCTECTVEVDGPTYTEHTFTGTVKQAATCKAEGVMLYTCTKCHAEEEKSIAIDPEAHAWDNGKEITGAIEYKCTLCNKTKKTIKAAEGAISTQASTDALKEVDEVEVNGAAIKLDDAVLGQLAGDVTIEAETKTPAQAGVSTEIANKIGNQPIYDFSLTSTAGSTNDGNFGNGKVTVTIPYKLGEGEDPDCIEVWYIGTDNKVTSIRGKYSNGFVTFETNHFSYYTVVRLTPAERCAKYGHNNKEFKVDPTCTTAGYTRTVCLRCAQTTQVDAAALGHAYDKDTKAATCTTDGYKKEVCKREDCGNVKEEIYAAPGHDWQKDTPVEATCSSKGYQRQVCSVCHVEEKEYDSTPIGHAYEEEWVWDKAKLTATVKLTCSREACDHTREDKAVVALTKQTVASCADKGETIYTAQVVVDSIIYDDTYTITEEQLPHKLGNEVKYNQYFHYKECSVCGTRVNEEDHKMNDGEVTAAPTCEADGVKTYSCACGYTEEETIPALAHNLVNGKCTNCGFSSLTCDHDDLKYENVIFSEEDGYCGASLVYATCECGEVVSLEGLSVQCALIPEVEYIVDDHGYLRSHVVYACDDCGFHVDMTGWYESDDKCMSDRYTSLKVYDKDGKVVTDITGKIEVESSQHHACVYVSKEDASKYGFCGGSIYKMKCACGKHESYATLLDCVYTYDELNDRHVCKNCGISEEYDYETKYVGNCRSEYTQYINYYKDDVLVLSLANTGETPDHRETDRKEVLLGDTCTDGIKISEECKECGQTESWTTYPYSCYHGASYEEWDITEYELCCPTTYKEECACGNYVSSGIGRGHYWSFVEESEEVVSEDGKLHTSTRTLECTTCGLREKYTDKYKELDEPCEYWSSSEWEYSKDGKVIITEHNEYEYFGHEYKIIASEFVGESKSCEDGVKLTLECINCGDVVKDPYTYRYHETFVDSQFDTSKYGMCGGVAKTLSCACGEVQDYTWDLECDFEWTYDNKTGRYFWKCNDCGVEYQTSYKDETISGCLVYRTEICEFIKGQDVLFTLKNVWETYAHDYVTKVALKEGSKTCEDGITVTNTCKACGVSHSYNDRYHATGVKSEYDLSEYGAVCGSALVEESCACGENYNISLQGECDFGWISTQQWLGENYGWQNTTYGYVSASPTSYQIRCAVTSPACPVSLNTCTYYVWDKDNCSMQEIHVWQLGYDVTTGTYEKELTFTGRKFAFHDYEQTYSSDETGYENKSVCATCGSSYTSFGKNLTSGRYANSGNIAINTLNNGEPKERSNYWTYQYDEVLEYNYEMQDSYNVVYADGRTYSYGWTYTYDKENCTRTTVYTSSDGGYSTSTSAFHPTHGKYTQFVEQSCTQPDKYGYVEDCPVCNHYVVRGPYENNPWGHNYRYESSIGMYICSRCGLESANGADGTIVLEDMSDAYGEGTNYIIGYWNKSSGDFTNYVSIVNDENEEILDVTIDMLNYDEDGICALSINKAEVAAAAKGLEGDIRVTFVPVGSGGTLDYAITLTE